MKFILILAFVYAVNAGFDFQNLEEQAQGNNVMQSIDGLEIIPPEAKKFLNSLTAEDKTILQEVVNNGSQYSTVDDVLNALKDRSATLFNKATGVVSYIRETLDSLGPSARKFVEDTIYQLHSSVREGNVSLEKIKNEISKIVSRYVSLDEDTKEELKNAFPMVSTVVHNAIFQTLAQSLLGITGGSKGGGKVVPMAPSRDIPDKPANDNQPSGNIEETIVRQTVKPPSGEQVDDVPLDRK